MLEGRDSTPIDCLTVAADRCARDLAHLCSFVKPLCAVHLVNRGNLQGKHLHSTDCHLKSRKMFLYSYERILLFHPSEISIFASGLFCSALDNQ